MARFSHGDFVKVELVLDLTGECEWLWLRVDHADDGKRLVCGWLESTPLVLDQEFWRGQYLALSYDCVRGHKRRES